MCHMWVNFAFALFNAAGRKILANPRSLPQCFRFTSSLHVTPALYKLYSFTYIITLLMADLQVKWLFCHGRGRLVGEIVFLWWPWHTELRWQNWLQDVYNITKFLKTGELPNDSQLSEANKNELIQAAQKYYIESTLIQSLNYRYTVIRLWFLRATAYMLKRVCHANSVHLSIYHTRVLCQNSWTYHQNSFTIW